MAKFNMTPYVGISKIHNLNYWNTQNQVAPQTIIDFLEQTQHQNKKVELQYPHVMVYLWCVGQNCKTNTFNNRPSLL